MEFQVRRYKISKVLAYGQEEIDNKTSIGILTIMAGKMTQGENSSILVWINFEIDLIK